MRRGVYVFLLLCLLAGCAPNPSSPTPSPALTVSPTPSPPPATPSPSPAPLPTPPSLEIVLTPPEEGELWGRRSLQVEYQSAEGKLLFEGDLILPYIPNATGGYETIEENCRAWMASNLEDIQLGMEICQELGLYCYLISYGNIGFCRGNLAQLVIYEEGYLGGAHGFHHHSSTCYDLETGETMKLSDLFADWPTAREVIWTALEPQVMNSVNANLAEEAATQAYEYLDDTPFFIEDEGITIHYNEYAIAAYAYGNFDFLLPKDLLAPLSAYPLWD